MEAMSALTKITIKLQLLPTLDFNLFETTRCLRIKSGHSFIMFSGVDESTEALVS